MRIVLAGCAILAVSFVGSSASGQSGQKVCPLAGSWSQTTDGVGSSTWDVSSDGKAQEAGLGGARGTATLQGGVLTIQSHPQDSSYDGTYTWNVQPTEPKCTGTGTLKFTNPPRAGETHSSTVSGPAPVSPPPPAKLPPTRPPSAKPRLGVPIDYKVMPPGEVGDYNQPKVPRGKRLLGAEIRFVDNAGHPVEGPDFDAVSEQLDRAVQVCYLLGTAHDPDASERDDNVFGVPNPDLALCAYVVARVLARSDQIRKQQSGPARAAAAGTRCPQLVHHPKRARVTLRVSCRLTARGARLSIRAKHGTLRQALGGHALKLVVARSSIPAAGGTPARLRVKWTAK